MRSNESLSRQTRHDSGSLRGSAGSVSWGLDEAKTRRKRGAQHGIAKRWSRTKCRSRIVETSEPPGHQLERLVREVDVKFSPRAFAPSKLAADDGLFLASKAEFDVDGLASHEVILALALVNRTMARLDRALVQGNELLPAAGVQAWDETFASNLGHVLLVLQHALIQALLGRPDGRERSWQRVRSRLAGWFSVFPSGQRPVGTTWPWTIRPSLAVLWGVCWMFAAGHDGQQGWEQSADGSSRPRVRAARIIEEGSFAGWPGPEDGAYGRFGREALAGVAIDRAGHVRAAAPHPRRNKPGGDESRKQTRGADWRPQLLLHAAAAGLSAPNARSSGAPATAFRWPYQSGIATQATPIDALPRLLHHSPARQHIPTPPVPDLRIEDWGFAALQPAPDAYFNAAPPSPRRAVAAFLPSAHYMDPLQHNPPSGMPDAIKPSGPVSPVSPVSMSGRNSMAPAHSRKRKLSDLSTTHVPRDRDSSEEHYDGYTPRGKYSHKRTEDPPRSAENKMICTFSPDCQGITFERKCEWSKHMDKHDRPYVCRHKGCEKLQGFTYSGGLLRHEREVHKMHGGTKKALFCPHQDCKRSMGQGFTRKENLAEHIRRVHRRPSGSDAASTGAKAEDEGSDAMSPDAEADETYGAVQRPASGKKRRTSGAVGDGGGETDEDDLREEIKRLRRENDEKDERLRELEAVVTALSRQGRGEASGPI